MAQVMRHNRRPRASDAKLRVVVMTRILWLLWLCCIRLSRLPVTGSFGLDAEGQQTERASGRNCRTFGQLGEVRRQSMRSTTGPMP
jgi:hypothetical protein